MIERPEAPRRPISNERNPIPHPRLFIIDPNRLTGSYLKSLFHPQPPSPALSQDCCTVIDSFAALQAADLQWPDLVICAAVLPDASGLDAIAHIRSVRADLPVIIIGRDSSLAAQAIRCGAIDFILAHELHHFDSLPLAVEKCLAHQRVRQESDQFVAATANLKKSLAELSTTNQQLQDVIRQLEAMARTDELTGLSNRRWFNLMLEGYWADATRNNLPLACLMIDLDEFKSVNDALGHHEGDELLRLAANVLRANCREIDVPSRYGGDEFCVLMSHTALHDAAAVAQRILRQFEIAVQQFSQPNLRSSVSMSMGLAHVDISRPINAEQLVHHADQAMYAAKAAGKQRIMVRFAENMQQLSELGRIG